MESLFLSCLRGYHNVRHRHSFVVKIPSALSWKVFEFSALHPRAGILKKILRDFLLPTPTSTFGFPVRLRSDRPVCGIDVPIDTTCEWALECRQSRHGRFCACGGRWNLAVSISGTIPARILFLDLKRCCILVVGLNNPITEFLPVLSPDAGSLVFFLTRKTAVLDAPQRELFPTMKRHCWCTNHHLIKLEGYRVAVSYVARQSPWTNIREK